MAKDLGLKPTITRASDKWCDVCHMDSLHNVLTSCPSDLDDSVTSLVDSIKYQ